MMYPGIDIIEIARFKKACDKQPRILQRLFTDGELAALEGKNIASYAVRFSGKEAVFKALGTGLGNLSWHDVEIISNDLGEPIVRLSARAAAIAKSRGVNQVNVSLSHSRENAIAMAVCIP
jgi:holo-[acyl-carrier protein] synthase